MSSDVHFNLNQLIMKYVYRIQHPLTDTEKQEVSRVASNSYGFSFITFIASIIIFVVALGLRFRNAQFLFIASTIIGHMLIAFYYEHYMLRLSLVVKKRITKTMPHVRMQIFYSALRSGILVGAVVIAFESWQERIMTINIHALIVFAVATLVFHVARLKFLALRPSIN